MCERVNSIILLITWEISGQRKVFLLVELWAQPLIQSWSELHNELLGCCILERTSQKWISAASVSRLCQPQRAWISLKRAKFSCLSLTLFVYIFIFIVIKILLYWSFLQQFFFLSSSLIISKLIKILIWLQYKFFSSSISS